MNRKIIDHSTAGGASWGSQLAPGSFYLVANLRESNRTKTKTKNHLHSYLYKTCQAALAGYLGFRQAARLCAACGVR